jgi:hypothetical protein
VKRRHLLLGAGAALVAATLGFYGAEFLSEDAIAAGVRRRLGALRLDEDGPHAFARDYIAAMLAKRPTWFRTKYHLRRMFAAQGAIADAFVSDHRSRRRKFEDDLATVYLMSSDFFWNHANESRIVHYVALYDPMRACGNPFARPPPGEYASG